MKQKLIEILSASEEQRISKLLFHAELGGNSPSDFYRKMKQLAGTSTDVSENFVKRLWIGRLPKPIEVALISVGEKDILELLKIADKIWEASRGTNISGIKTNTNNVNDTDNESTAISGNELLIEEIRHLSRRLQYLETSVNPNHMAPYKRYGRSNSRNDKKRILITIHLISVHP